MKLSNGTEVIAKPYCEEDAEEIVRLIRRNFKEVNVKDYGEKAMSALCATHDVNWFKGVAGVIFRGRKNRNSRIYYCGGILPKKGL